MGVSGPEWFSAFLSPGIDPRAVVGSVGGGDLTEAAPVWIAAFILGSIPFALLLGFTRGVDLRSAGSGNVGATNLGRNAGFRWGVIAFLLDAAKGAGPVLYVSTVGFSAALGTGDEGRAVVAGGAAVLGHCYSPFLRFRGGKGVATMAGVLLALAPLLLTPLLACWAGIVAWKRNVGLASVVSAIAALGVGIWLALGPHDPPRPWLAGLLVVLPLVVIVRHRSNIRKILEARGGSS